jgi:MraZ protein
MIGLLGEYEATLDSKGRFLLPVGFKKQLPDGDSAQFVIARGFEKCLNLYPKKNWDEIFEKLSKLDDFDPKVRDFIRYYLSGATLTELDSAGRLLVPPNLKSHASLEKDISLSAAINKIEIWDSKYKDKLFETFTPQAFSDLGAEIGRALRGI